MFCDQKVQCFLKHARTVERTSCQEFIPLGWPHPKRIVALWLGLGGLFKKWAGRFLTQ